MFDRIRFFSAGLIGLLIGVALALPLFWIAVKSNVGAIRHNAEQSFAQVESRQQAMSDESLRLQKLLSTLGWNKRAADFSHVELLRSKLAGFAGFEDRILISQELERALLDVERDWSKLSADSAEIGKNAFVVKFGLTWDPMKRYLVVEEAEFSSRVSSYNAVLGTWPVTLIVGYPSFAALLNACGAALRDKASLYLRQGWNWVSWCVRLGVDKLRGLPAPERPVALPTAPALQNVLYSALPQPHYVAKAPLPEEDYKQIQYRRPYANMADVGLGDEAPVLENKYIQPYAVPVPTVQRTVTYK